MGPWLGLLLLLLVVRLGAGELLLELLLYT
jgi:hypothetical protein